MTRFFGLMPTSEIEKHDEFLDQDGNLVIIDAGKHGWTILWCDSGTTYEDIDDTTENNFQAALNACAKRGFILTKANAKSSVETLP